MTTIPDTALAALAAFEAGTLTPEGYLRALLERCAEAEPQIHAWAHLDPEGALARLAGAGAPGQGALAGLPIGVKDVIHAEGLPRTCGSPIYAGAISPVDAAVVALARLAGAYVMGKTETTEFATYRPAPTRNPAAPGHTPGGSSSGSAAAVAAGMVPLALGTQTAGSVVRPAAYCGVVGYKPSFDLIEPGGVKALARSFDTVGVFARSVADAALFAEAVTGLPLLRGARAPEAPRAIGLCRSPVWDRAAPEMQAAWDELGARLRGKVATVELELPAEYGAAIEAHPRIMAREAFQALSHEWHSHRELLSPQLRAMLEEGRDDLPGEAQAEGRAMIDRLRQRFAADLGDTPILVTPSAPGAAPAFDSGTGSPDFNRLWTLLGGPCVNVPGLRAADGRPVGVQVVGPMGRDAEVLRAAAWLAGLLA
ncbi:amidase [Actibacterium sp. MT2.3-13A]|uniref:amidase n=1 Tax=Actibacterium sp. MT2.3-13A TaxID=2828332 RepID=UPI001BA5A1D2|nr:amidase [Actibacterium sp. MT2.3-13A]